MSTERMHDAVVEDATRLLPRRCACGGKLHYATIGSYISACCNRCTPVIRVKEPK